MLNPNAPPKSAKIATDAFAYARPEPISGDWGNVGAEISKAMAEVYAGKVDAKGALTPIVPVVESLLSKTPVARHPRPPLTIPGACRGTPPLRSQAPAPRRRLIRGRRARRPRRVQQSPQKPLEQMSVRRYT